ncbi:MAG: DedA family protein [Candidatus Aenigmatarchaeota archaeon]
MFSGYLYETVFNFLVNFVSSYNFLAIFVLSFLETLFAPLPSEIVLPFAGFWAWKQSNFYLAIIAIIVGALGNTLGSLPLYYLGYLGRNYIEKYGKYFFIRKDRLKFVESWFNKNSMLTVFFTRFIPGIRSLVSIPAGIFKMKLKKYLILTFLGFLIWNSILVSLGFYFGEYWESSLKYSSQIENFALLIFFAVILYLVLKYLI